MFNHSPLTTHSHPNHSPLTLTLTTHSHPNHSPLTRITLDKLKPLVFVFLIYSTTIKYFTK